MELRPEKCKNNLCTQPSMRLGVLFLRLLKIWAAIAQHLIMSHGVAVLPDGIAGVPFNGVNAPVLYLLHNPCMVGKPVLPVFIVPVKEDNHAGGRFGGAVHPLAPVLEPLYAIDAPCIFGNYAGINIAALVGAPAHKTRAPFHTAGKTIPAPVRLAAHIPYLGERHGDDGPVLGVNAVKNGAPQAAVSSSKSSASCSFCSSSNPYCAAISSAVL